MNAQQIEKFRQEVFEQVVKAFRALQSGQFTNTADFAAVRTACAVHEAAFNAGQCDLPEIPDDDVYEKINEALEELDLHLHNSGAETVHLLTARRLLTQCLPVDPFLHPDHDAGKDGA